MTTERKKALFMMGATFLIGIVIGSLTMGMVARQFYHGRGGNRIEGGEVRDGRRGSLTDKIFKTIKADSSQKILMKPIIDQTMTRIDDLEKQSHTAALTELDSLKIKLRPILHTGQVQPLEQFLSMRGKPSGDVGKHNRHRN